MPTARRRCFPIFSLIIPVLAGLLFLSGCGGGGGEEAQSAPPQPQTALVVGDASGAVYDELATAYHVSLGTGMEPPAGFDVLIYGQSLTPEQIETLPSTDSFLNAGKILIVLDPSLEDLGALEGTLGAAALVDTPAQAIFKTFYGDRGLQATTVVEFPKIQNEDPAPADDSSGQSDAGNLSQSTGTIVYQDDATKRAQTAEWRKLYERMRAATWRTMRALAHISSARLAAVAIDDGSGRSPVTEESSAPGGAELASWLDAPENIDLPLTSPFWTVRQFRETEPVITLKMQSAIYQPKLIVDGVKPKSEASVTFCRWRLRPLTLEPARPPPVF